jgi:hypothetical protein
LAQKIAHGHGMPQAVWPLITEAWVHDQLSTCGICGGQTGTGIGFTPSSSVSLINIILPGLHIYCNVLVGSIHDGTLLHSKSQYTTVKHSRQLSGHTYTSDMHGLGTLTPIKFFQQDPLQQSSNTHSHSCSQKDSKHTSGQSIVGPPVQPHSTTAPRHTHNQPAIYQPRHTSTSVLEQISNHTD